MVLIPCKTLNTASISVLIPLPSCKTYAILVPIRVQNAGYNGKHGTDMYKILIYLFYPAAGSV